MSSEIRDEQNLVDKLDPIGKVGASGASDAEVFDVVASAPQEQLLPWEEAELPSRGLYYNWTSGVIRVRPWGANVDRILANQRMVQNGQALTTIFNVCCRFPDGFDVEDLIVGDQVFLLYYLRGITHGENYEFTVQCPDNDCKQHGIYNVNLTELSNNITWADPNLGEEPFRVVLPYLSERTGREFYVNVRFLRVSDVHDIRNTQSIGRRISGDNVRFKNQMYHQPTGMESADDTFLKNIERLVVSSMGVDDRFKIRHLIGNLHSSDLATIRDWLTNHTPGVDPSVEITCNSCANAFKVMLPITESFFRRTPARDV